RRPDHGMCKSEGREQRNQSALWRLLRGLIGFIAITRSKALSSPPRIPGTARKGRPPGEGSRATVRRLLCPRVTRAMDGGSKPGGTFAGTTIAPQPHLAIQRLRVEALGLGEHGIDQ